MLVILQTNTHRYKAYLDWVPGACATPKKVKEVLKEDFIIQ